MAAARPSISTAVKGFSDVYIGRGGKNYVRCTVDGCGKEYRSGARHLMLFHTERHAKVRRDVKKAMKAAPSGPLYFNDSRRSEVLCYLQSTAVPPTGIEAQVEYLLVKKEKLKHKYRRLEKKNEQLKKELAALKESRDFSTCTICLDGQCTVAFGCGHRACAECAGKLSHCHACRGSVERKLRLF